MLVGHTSEQTGKGLDCAALANVFQLLLTWKLNIKKGMKPSFLCRTWLSSFQLCNATYAKMKVSGGSLLACTLIHNWSKTKFFHSVQESTNSNLNLLPWNPVFFKPMFMCKLSKNRKLMDCVPILVAELSSRYSYLGLFMFRHKSKAP